MNNANKDTEDKPLLLPTTVIGHAHLSQLIRELEVVENDLESQKARNKAGTAPRIPAMSRALSDCIELNGVDIANGQQRMHLKTLLGKTKNKAPTMHFTFATEADPESLQKLAEWIRREIHPQALISVGLQPALIGGTYLRTPNHVHDFSLRVLLHDKRSIISTEIERLLA